MKKNSVFSLVNLILLLFILHSLSINLILTVFITLYYISLLKIGKTINNKKIIYRIVYDIALIFGVLLAYFVLTKNISWFHAEIAVSLVLISLSVLDNNQKYTKESVKLQFFNNLITFLIFIKFLLISVDGNFSFNISSNAYLLDQDINYIVLLSFITSLHQNFNKIK